MNRRSFISLSSFTTVAVTIGDWRLLFSEKGYIMGVKGKIELGDVGLSLSHEHIVTDFIGALQDQIKYSNDEAIALFLPHLKKLYKSGIRTIFECTPSYIGKNVVLLKSLSSKSGLNIVTNTGYYAAAGRKYLPKHVFKESAEELAKRWVADWKTGIDGSGIKPGFIKLGVDAGPLKDVEQKLIRAAAITHLKTGLKIAIHTGNAEAALEEANLLSSLGVNLNAFIWVHAQNDVKGDTQLALAKKGCWISLDGINESDQTLKYYSDRIHRFKENRLLHKLLISHDDGFSVSINNEKISFAPYQNGNSKPYQAIFSHLKPILMENKILNEIEFQSLLTLNPAAAFKIEN